MWGYGARDLCSAINGIHHFLNNLILDLVTRKCTYIRALFTQAEGADDVLSFPPIIGERYTRRYALGEPRRKRRRRKRRARFQLHRWTNIAARCTLCTRNVTWKDVIPTTTSFSVSTFRLLWQRTRNVCSFLLTRMQYTSSSSFLLRSFSNVFPLDVLDYRLAYYNSICLQFFFSTSCN